MIAVLWVISLVLLQLLADALEPAVLKVDNHAGTPIDILWVDGENGQLHDIARSQRNSEAVVVNTFQSHQFVIRRADSLSPNEVQEEDVTFTKGFGEERIEVYHDEPKQKLWVFVAGSVDAPLRSLREAFSECQDLPDEEYVSCVAKHGLNEMKRLNDASTRMSKYRDALAFRLRNYTCADPKIGTSLPVSSYDYNYITLTGKPVQFEVKVFLDTERAKVWVVEDFASELECDTLEAVGRPLLRRATVAAEDGTSIVSEHRKAQQAGYDFHQRHADDPLADLQQRILALTNFHANYSLTSAGQEGFTVIQYNPDDEYFPHCDGSCDGLPHVKTGRVATAVLYCKAPEEGGATTFTKADLYVRPKRLAATFFSYMGPDKTMDSGLTEHSGCPVLKGEKLIATFWMREGVSAEADWTQFDPSGLPILLD